MDSKLKVPARSEIEVMASVPKAATDGSSWLVEGSSVERNPLLVARSIVSPKKKEIPMSNAIKKPVGLSYCPS